MEGEDRNVADVSTHTVEFQVVSYWNRSFSAFQSPTLGPPVLGSLVDLQAQSTVRLRFGDGTWTGFEYKFINQNSLYTETQFIYVPWKVTFEVLEHLTPWTPSTDRHLTRDVVVTVDCNETAILRSISRQQSLSMVLYPSPLIPEFCLSNLPDFTRLDANTGDIKWDVAIPGIYHLCISVSLASQPTVYSDVDFLVVSQAGDQIGFQVGFVPAMRNGPTAPDTGHFTVVSAQIASGSAEATLKFTVQPWMEGWNSFCFAAYVINDMKISSASSMKCSDAYFFGSDVIMVDATAAEQYKYRVAGQVVANHFEVREGVQLRVSISAWMPNSLGAVERSMVADLNGNGVLDESEVEELSFLRETQVACQVQIFYGNRPRPLGATLTNVSLNTSILTYEPPRTYAGADIEICINAQGASSAATLSKVNQFCITIMVKKCVWTVKTGESFISIAQSIGISWLQLWNFNKGNYSRPDIDLRTGDPVNVGQLYQVDNGDTLYNIADRFSSTVPILYALNGALDPQVPIYTGQLICIAFASCANT
ncbi:hypothetical protein GUITHDRAFT_135834 [Guillardia theta CCMP2712]|uniref:LysM domain-containing protein n=1 Tax=Guillardia theta (strain CCMP2712) TaxID=905079 RepID=L1JMH5_GUITC|nr:hypothetical protein GUITHDRAFT_135834 [Guillardia theta CCMP2712]EKX49657.1 hypothetical protein GUITHDRAFT_135834 [Guillardia theta CCMP2712]|eukprot:XP_005836637.1 hypothetical protein GUITHDRAFT_135834 [Guillardia theta CCMP2712]